MVMRLNTLIPLLCTLLACISAPATAQRLPSWMVGRYRGYDRAERRDVTLEIGSAGSLRVTVSATDRNVGRLTASLRRTALTLDGAEYRLERTTDGFRAIPVDDRNSMDDPTSEITFRRLESPYRAPAAERGTPDWMIGRFDAVDPSDGRTIRLRISRDGEFTITRGGEYSDARITQGSRSGLMVIDGRTYRLSETADGFLAVPVNGDRSSQADEIEFRRLGPAYRSADDTENGAGDDPRFHRTSSRPPSWMVGTFTGYDRRDRQTITLTFDSRGGLIVRTRGINTGAPKLTVALHGTVLTLRGTEYDLERTSDGIRAIPVIDDADSSRDAPAVINLRRVAGN